MEARRRYSVKRQSTAHVVRDRAQLAAVIGELVTAVGEGNAGVTAKRLALSPAMVSQLARERRGRISPMTHRALVRGIYSLRRTQGARAARPMIDRLLGRLNDAVAYPMHAEARRDAFEDWCAERGERFIRRRGDRWELDADGRPYRVDWSEMLDGDEVGLVDDGPPLSRVVELLRRDDYRLVMLRLHTPRTRTRAALVGFERFCDERRPPVSAARRLVAFVRIVEPLLEVAESGLLEAHWRDLDDRRLAAFVSHGVMREKLLLR
jgi:hypothetical protein